MTNVSGPARSIIIGGRGQVGRALQAKLLLENGSENVHFTSRDSLNLEDLASIQRYFEEVKFARDSHNVHVYLTGAFTHVDGCERDQKKCRLVNMDGPIQVGKECARRGWRLLFYSSEYVFGAAEYNGGATGPFRETDPVAPTCVYGQSKAEAEAGLQEISGLDLAIVRTTTVFSWKADDMNFAMQLRRFLQERLANQNNVLGSPFRIPTDQISTPTYAPALALASISLAKSPMKGIFHIAGSDLLSRAEFTKRLIALFGMSLEKCESFLEFQPTAKLGQLARRPLTAGLVTEKAKANGLPIFSVDQAFAEYSLLLK